MKQEFTALRDANKARQKEWDTTGQITIEFRGNELAGEVGEACNLIKKIARERLGLPGSRAKISDLAEELADVVICADLVAMDVGIDLDCSIAEKFNKTSEKIGLQARLIKQTELIAQFHHEMSEAYSNLNDCANENLALRAENERLRAAIAEISTKKQSSYKGRNGRDCYIEDASGEMMWLVPSDAMAIADATLKGGAV